MKFEERSYALDHDVSLLGSGHFDDILMLRKVERCDRKWVE